MWGSIVCGALFVVVQMPGPGKGGGGGGEPFFIQPDGEQEDAVALICVFVWADAQAHAFALKGEAVGESTFCGLPSGGLQIGDEALPIRHTPLGVEGVAILHPEGVGYIEVPAGDVQISLDRLYRWPTAVYLLFF